MQIYKYEMEVDGVVDIPMPKGAHVLTVKVQHGKPCLWAIVDPDAPTETRSFRVFGTGHEMDIDIPHSHYIGTYQLFDGNFLGHVFEA